MDRILYLIPAFLLAFALFVAAVPLLVGFALMARKRTRAGKTVLGIYAVLIVFFFLDAFIFQRSTPGRIVRFFRGTGMAKQEVEDQVDDLKHSASLPQIQAWAVETLRRFRAGQVSTNGDASYWSLGKVQLGRSEIPEFVLAQWKSAEPPEISIGLSDSGEPKFVVVAWYLKGVVIADPGYRPPISAPDYQQEVIPGVYAYYLYK